MDLFFVLLVLLVVTRVFGELAVRANQPSLVGELLGGIILGITLGLGSELNNISWLPDLSQLKGTVEVLRHVLGKGSFEYKFSVKETDDTGML